MKQANKKMKNPERRKPGIPDRIALRIVRYLAKEHYKRQKKMLDEIADIIDMQQKAELDLKEKPQCH